VLSYFFYERNLMLPVIAAGDNLNFQPVGPIFRRCGAFFIRRSFKGDRLYAAVVDAYVRRLIRDGFPIELFLEGGRSRTGKLLEPKLGLLNMIVDSALGVPMQKVHFVPVSIGYERVIEADSYQRELSGAEKKKEEASDLLSASEVLRHRYGRINLQFGTIMTLADIGDDLGINGEDMRRPAKRRAVVTRLGNRVMDEINRVTAVTPGALTALVLLGHDQRGLAHDELVARAERLLVVLDQLGARKSPALNTPTGALRAESIRESLQMFADTELVEIHLPARVPGAVRRGQAGPGAFYVVSNDQRLALDTSKNVIVHFFVERALVALALLAAPDPPPDLEWVRERVRALSRLFKVEFRFRADLPFESIFAETVQKMRTALEIELVSGRPSVPN
jgi:glycerol-3-phosphate O-acyltransferase